MPFELVIPFLRIFVKEIIRNVEKYSCSKVFTVEVFIIAKIRNNFSSQQRGKRNGKAIEWKYCTSILDVLEEF